MTEQEPNILLMRLKSMGDVVFTLPAVHLLRESFPRARITFLVSAENAPLLEGFREVDETIALNRARYRSGNPLHILTETFTLFRRLRGGRFSLVVDFQGNGVAGQIERRAAALGQRAHHAAALGLYPQLPLQLPHSPG
jgi:ADP-heptose:LPS heptosyltransferase